jgi:hypothetical protein
MRTRAGSLLTSSPSSSPSMAIGSLPGSRPSMTVNAPGGARCGGQGRHVGLRFGVTLRVTNLNLPGNIDDVPANPNDQISNEKIEIQTSIVIGPDVSIYIFLIIFKVELYFGPKTKTYPCNLSYSHKNQQKSFEIRRYLFQRSE